MLWNSQHLTSYTFRIGTGGFPVPGGERRVTITVSSGRPSDSTSIPLQRGYPGTPLDTFPNLFRTVRRALDDPKAGTAIVTYDTRRGYPRSASIDPILMGVDDEFGWKIDRFRPR